MTTPSTNPAENLAGVRLPDGWTVLAQVPFRPGATGGNFSVSYTVQHDDGRLGFCKVLNYFAAMSSADPVRALKGLADAYVFERDLLRECGDEGMSRVVLSVGDGEFQRSGYTPGLVSYLIFEPADGDIRKIIDTDPTVTIAAKLRWLHHAATGLRQLHDRGVAHQDVKPSNVLVFAPDEQGELPGKIGDLGRATDPQRPMWHDNLGIAGDPTYAPPEQLYGATPTEFGPRRLACDLYQLGSVATFLLTGATMNSLLKLELYPVHFWTLWRGTYADVLPYVRDAFGRAIARIPGATGDVDTDRRLVSLIEDLCDPDPTLRGHRLTRRRAGNQYSLERVVTEFDLLTRKTRAAALRRVS